MPEMELVDSIPAPAAEIPSPAAPEVVVEPAVAEPTTEAPVAEPVTPEPALFELPDGRKVDADTLQKEWKENFYPEFTRKSQELAALKTPITQEEPAWKNPDFSPTTWAEAIEIAKAEAVKDILAQASQADAEQARVRAEVDTQITEIKAIDPQLDENALFQHATKYGFRDLKSAYGNFKAMQDVMLTTEQRVLKNVTKHSADPISTSPSVAPVASAKIEVDRVRANDFRSAADFLEAIKKK